MDDIAISVVGSEADTARVLIQLDKPQEHVLDNIRSILDELADGGRIIVLDLEQAKCVVRKMVGVLSTFDDEFVHMLGAHAKEKRHKTRRYQVF